MKKQLLIAGAFFATVSMIAQTSYTFVTAGVKGRLGPTQTQLNTAYAPTNLNGLVVSTTPTFGHTTIYRSNQRHVFN